MWSIRKKSKWQRAAEPLSSHLPAKSAIKSGVGTVIGALSLTAASAVVSAVRRRGDDS